MRTAMLLLLSGRPGRLPPKRSIALLLPLLTVACLPLFSTVEVRNVESEDLAAQATFSTPIRAYLSDGSIAVLPNGGSTSAGMLVGEGWRYGITLADSVPFTDIATDSVIGAEVFREEQVNQLGTAVLFAGSVAAAALAGSALAVAIFGSCPTIYADVAGRDVLQMEAFSYSIAPLFESRDVASLSGADPGAGTLRLDLRNEALETHYINQIELLEVPHRQGERALPDPNGRPIVVVEEAPALQATDRDGRDVTAFLAALDEQAFRSSASRLASATALDYRDHVDLRVPVPAGRERVTLALTLRNTLLNSVLFYDVILAESGAHALDWLGSEMDRIGAALEMGTWYQDRMGMRILVPDGEGWREVEHIGDVGPIAWKEVAVSVPVSGDAEQATIRLEFVSDSWFIDRVRVAADSHRTDVVRHPLALVRDADGSEHDDAAALLLRADGDYFVTLPGQRYDLEFDLDAPGSGQARTLLLAAQGYYVEWVRGTWLANSNPVGTFEPSDPALLRALRRWESVQADFERDFHATRIPVR